MHIHFIAIGGAGIGPLAQIAYQAGYKVSGSDIQNSSYIDYLKAHGIEDIHIGGGAELIDQINQAEPIDWVVYSSALTVGNDLPPELVYCQENGIKFSKRDEFINKLLTDKGLRMIAVAGTHGKTTTTAMMVWLFKSYKIPLSYILPAKVSYGEMGEYNPSASFFVYEADEFDRNFLAFKPSLSIITGVTYDHQEIYPTVEDYKQAFVEFIAASDRGIIWQKEASYLGVSSSDLAVEDPQDPMISRITLKGAQNREDAWLSIKAFSLISGKPIDELIDIMNQFPGLSRRMEQIIPGLYSDYAHTPEKIAGAMSAAKEIAQQQNKKLVVVYEPLTNRRQVYMKDLYKDCFNGADKLYWIPSYLAREDPNQAIIEPSELIQGLSDPSIAEACQRDDYLRQKITEHLQIGDMVVAMAGGGGDSLDDWIRQNFITA